MEQPIRLVKSRIQGSIQLIDKACSSTKAQKQRGKEDTAPSPTGCASGDTG